MFNQEKSKGAFVMKDGIYWLGVGVCGLMIVYLVVGFLLR